MTKLKSRKLWLGVATTAVVALLIGLDVPLTETQLIALVSPVLAAIFGLAHVDAAAEKAKGGPLRRTGGGV